MSCASPPLADPDGTNRRVLVVDDNPAIHADFRKILCPRRADADAVIELETILFAEAPRAREDIAFELSSAHQGQEALEMVRDAVGRGRPFAVAFVDVRMPPGWDGIETVSRLWQVDPSLQVVVCTAYSDYSWDEMRQRLGQPESLVVLKKPFDNVEVQQLAHALTRKWQLNFKAEEATRQLESVVGCMRELLDLERRNAPAASGGRASPRVPVVPGEGRRHLAEVLLQLRQSTENTFRQLRETESQLVQAEKMASLGRLSAGIMHEINNPLNYTLAALDVSRRFARLLPEPDREEFLGNLGDVREGLVRVRTIVQDLREFSHPRGGVVGRVSIRRSIDVALRMLTGQVEGQVRVENLVPEDFLVSAVSGRLTQVFLNLAQNSVDALRGKRFPAGEEPRLRFEGSEVLGVPVVRVWDNGPGVPAGALPRLFEPFYTTKEVGRGTGLGLSICYRLLEGIGAKVTVRSEENRWFEVTITFPAEA